MTDLSYHATYERALRDEPRPFFDGREMIGTLPQAAIDDCSTPGQDATASVKYWVHRLAFDAPADLTREYLAGYGCWDDDELADHDVNIQRLLWIICGNLREEPDYPIYLES
jgi:hypothetical protein